ncbi:hypothetical protein Fcan01_09020 [Folsomia candida]|uniref:Uncharacterized protein n=1 Tax=Folsomia candida TaxID=158441 RepID=A0A226EEF2_FOLCA|nr:hypothetical protein Fcan01_09020 [Folsomia candida]
MWGATLFFALLVAPSRGGAGDVDAYLAAIEKEAQTLLEKGAFAQDIVLTQKDTGYVRTEGAKAGSLVFKRKSGDEGKAVVGLKGEEDHLPKTEDKRTFVVLRQTFDNPKNYWVMYAYVRDAPSDSKDAVDVAGSKKFVEFDTWDHRGHYGNEAITFGHTTCHSSPFVPCRVDDADNNVFEEAKTVETDEADYPDDFLAAPPPALPKFQAVTTSAMFFGKTIRATAIGESILEAAKPTLHALFKKLAPAVDPMVGAEVAIAAATAAVDVPAAVVKAKAISTTISQVAQEFLKQLGVLGLLSDPLIAANKTLTPDVGRILGTLILKGLLNIKPNLNGGEVKLVHPNPALSVDNDVITQLVGGGAGPLSTAIQLQGSEAVALQNLFQKTTGLGDIFDESAVSDIAAALIPVLTGAVKTLPALPTLPVLNSVLPLNNVLALNSVKDEVTNTISGVGDTAKTAGVKIATSATMGEKVAAAKDAMNGMMGMLGKSLGTVVSGELKGVTGGLGNLTGNILHGEAVAGLTDKLGGLTGGLGLLGGGGQGLLGAVSGGGLLSGSGALSGLLGGLGLGKSKVSGAASTAFSSAKGGMSAAGGAASSAMGMFGSMMGGGGSSGGGTGRSMDAAGPAKPKKFGFFRRSVENVNYGLNSDDGKRSVRSPNSAPLLNRKRRDLEPYPGYDEAENEFRFDNDPDVHFHRRSDYHDNDEVEHADFRREYSDPEPIEEQQHPDFRREFGNQEPIEAQSEIDLQRRQDPPPPDAPPPEGAPPLEGGPPPADGAPPPPADSGASLGSGENPNVLGNALGGLVAGIGNAASSISDSPHSGENTGVLANLGNGLTQTLGGVSGTLAGAGHGVGHVVDGLQEGVGNLVTGLGVGLSDGLGQIVDGDLVGGVGSVLGGTVAGVGGALTGIGGGLFNLGTSVGSGLLSTGQGLGNTLAGTLGSLGSGLFGTLGRKKKRDLESTLRSRRMEEDQNFAKFFDDIDDGANLVRITINARQAEEEPQNNIPSMFDQLFGHVRSRKRRVPDDEPTTTAEPETTTELNVDKAADDVVAALYRKTTEKPGATTTPAPVATVQVVTTHGGYKGGLHGGLLGAVGGLLGRRRRRRSPDDDDAATTPGPDAATTPAPPGAATTTPKPGKDEESEESEEDEKKPAEKKPEEKKTDEKKGEKEKKKKKDKKKKKKKNKKKESEGDSSEAAPAAPKKPAAPITLLGGLGGLLGRRRRNAMPEDKDDDVTTTEKPASGVAEKVGAKTPLGPEISVSGVPTKKVGGLLGGLGGLLGRRKKRSYYLSQSEEELEAQLEKEFAREERQDAAPADAPPADGAAPAPAGPGGLLGGLGLGGGGGGLLGGLGLGGGGGGLLGGLGSIGGGLLSGLGTGGGILGSLGAGDILSNGGLAAGLGGVTGAAGGLLSGLTGGAIGGQPDDGSFSSMAKDAAAIAITDKLMGENNTGPTQIGSTIAEGIGGKLDSVLPTGGLMGSFLGKIGRGMDATVGAAGKSAFGNIGRETLKGAVKGVMNTGIGGMWRRKRRQAPGVKVTSKSNVDLFTTLGWVGLEGKDDPPGAGAAFIGFGPCKKMAPGEAGKLSGLDGDAVVTFFLTLLRVQCLESKVKEVKELLTKKYLIVGADKYFTVPEDLAVLKNRKLTLEESTLLSRALQLASFSQVIVAQLKPDAPPADLKEVVALTLNNSNPTIVTMMRFGLRHLTQAKSLAGPHLIKLSRNMVKALKSALTKVTQDYMVASFSTKYTPAEKQAAFENVFHLAGLIHFYINGLTPIQNGQDVLTTYDAFLKSNDKEIYKRTLLYCAFDS